MSRIPGLVGRIIRRQRQAPPLAAAHRQSKAQLLAEAKRRGLVLPKRAKLSEIVAALAAPVA